MEYIDSLFHFYSTTKSFESHKNQGVINPDSICFLAETGQIFTNNTLIGLDKSKYDKLAKVVLEHDIKIKNILGLEGPSVRDGDINNIGDVVKFLDGFTEDDNLKQYIENIKKAVVSQIESVQYSLTENHDISIFNLTLNLRIDIISPINAIKWITARN